jgi:hypothetical protein
MAMLSLNSQSYTFLGRNTNYFNIGEEKFYSIMKIEDRISPQHRIYGNGFSRGISCSKVHTKVLTAVLLTIVKELKIKAHSQR